MENLLLNAANIFNSYLNYQIHITLGKKGKKENLTIIFDKSDFHHLAGLHKLTDIEYVYKKKASDVFDKILKEEITQEDLQKSSFFYSIEDRLNIISCFDDIFRNNMDTFKFNKRNTHNYSNIKWTFLLEFFYNNEKGYLFLDQYRREPGNYICISDFKKENNRHTTGHTRFTLLEIILLDIRTSNETSLFLNPNYKKE